jgi:hypothetical protein
MRSALPPDARARFARGGNLKVEVKTRVQWFRGLLPLRYCFEFKL